jgi:hypothetical protein
MGVAEGKHHASWTPVLDGSRGKGDINIQNGKKSEIFMVQI